MAAAPGLMSRLQTAWPRLRRPVAILFFLFVVGLLVWQATEVDWAEVGQALREFQPAALIPAGLLAALSYTLYVTFDLLGKAYTRHDLPALRVAGVTFVSYAFNLNFGAIIGGMAFRFRLYSRLGLSTGTITRVVAISVFTNWLGYMGLSGAVLLSGFLQLPESWAADWVLRAAGAVLFGVFLLYLGATLFARRREWEIRGHTLVLPSFRFALLQAGLSIVHWMTVAAVIYVLLPEGSAAYPIVLGAFLLSAIAVVITHVPAGLGVTEAVFLALLGSSVGQGPLLASLVAFRAVHYLAPLALAAVIYAITEMTAKRAPAGGQAERPA